MVSPTILDNGVITSPLIPGHQQNLPLGVRVGFYPNVTVSTPTRDLLSYIFAPPDNLNGQIPFGGAHGRKGSPYDAWGDQAYRLENDSFKAEFTLDLVEVFFQIVHTRIPLLNPAQFRDGLQLSPPASTTPREPLHPALVATVLAWGTKFSEHPLLVADRQRPNGQSLLAKALIDRARDLAEALKVHRIPKFDHVVIGLLIEPLQSRQKPVLDDEDYDIDFYTFDPVNAESVDAHGGPLSSPREQLEFLGYYRAAHSLSRTARSMSRHLWKPVTDSEGIPFETLHKFTVDLAEWREKYLNLVGVPSNFKGDWDFVSVSIVYLLGQLTLTRILAQAVSSCASDATYHVMWIILFNALDDFGVKEINNRSVEPANQRIEEVKRKVLDEALHGALRIAGLAAVLTSNGYLRLDPAVMHVSCIQAGTLLARLGRQEVKSCIDGLEQYACSYEEAGEQALEMGRTYTQALNGEPQFSHMGMSVPTRATPEGTSASDDQDDMNMDIKMDIKDDRVQPTYAADPSFAPGYE
ncbi:hypothetical protein DXG03_004857 [Asterophora parasitica]|uniref:Uncharacterized protein n=1 Tax=Asterophora parasitica TaxID=117018 RepID=A0A9P7GCZ4_9AGAR|nr:hypothetical protein DXG03_004857 [Asterophora parasitica]